MVTSSIKRATFGARLIETVPFMNVASIARMLDRLETRDYSADKRQRFFPKVFRKRPMRTATIILTVAACLAITVFLLTRRTIPNSASVHAQQPPIEPGSIDDLVQNANANGQVLVTVPIEIMHEDVEGFDEAKTYYSIVVAQAVSKQSFAVSAYDIETWYKFTVTETLLTNAPHICVEGECPLPADLPAAGANEMWLAKSGGTIVRDGVTVDFQWTDFPDFNIGQKYLLFIDFNQGTSVGVPAIGPVGVFAVNNSDTLAPIFSEDTSLKSDISSRFGNSLSQIRNAINPPPPSTCDPVQQQACVDDGGSWNSDTCVCTPPRDPCIHKPWLCD